jgi:transcriptional regulator with XRE-family HTH domain
MEDREPTLRSRELGDGLRRAMESAGLNGRQAAELLGCSPSWVSRLLSGKRGGTEVDVAGFLAICGVTGPERDRLLGLCREQSRLGWLQMHGPRLPLQLRTLIDHEQKAVAISVFQAMLVDGLLQTGDYSRAVIAGNVNVPPEEVEDRVAARLARQSLLTRDHPPRLTYYLHELALRTPVGGCAVMAEQLRHLLRLAARPAVTLRVLPTKVGAHAAMVGPFTLLEFSDFRPIVYLESDTSSLFLERPVETTAYRNILAALARITLDEEESSRLIATLATQFESRGP